MIKCQFLIASGKRFTLCDAEAEYTLALPRSCAVAYACTEHLGKLVVECFPKSASTLEVRRVAYRRETA